MPDRAIRAFSTCCALLALNACDGTLSLGPVGGGDGGSQGARDGGSTPDLDARTPAQDGSDAPGDGAQGDGSDGATGGGPDGGPSPGDDGGQGGPTGAPCEAAGLTFCDDFERYGAGAVTADTSETWDPETQNGSLTLDAQHVHSGAQALHVHTDGNGRAYIRTPFTPDGNSAYGRMWMFLTAAPTAPDYAHFTLVEAAGDGAGVVRPIGGQYIPGSDANKSLWGVGSDGGPTGDWTNWQRTTPVTSGTWVCMEWQFDGANDGVNVSIDGVAKPELSVSRTNHGGNQVDFVFPRFTNLWFGWWLYQGGPTPSSFDLWLDDIALGSSPIGCNSN